MFQIFIQIRGDFSPDIASFRVFSRMERYRRMKGIKHAQRVKTSCKNYTGRVARRAENYSTSTSKMALDRAIYNWLCNCRRIFGGFVPGHMI